MAYIDINNNRIAYDCNELIEDLEADILEYGENLSLRVVIERRGVSTIYKEYYTEAEYFVALNEGDIHLGDGEYFICATAGELLELYKKENIE